MVSTRSVAGRAFAQASGELHAYDERNQHGHGLPEHGGFGFDSADAPAEHAESVDHGGVRIGADEGVGISGALAAFFVNKNHARQIFKIDLVDDSSVRRHDGEIAEAGLSPAQKRVALFVALEFEQRIDVEGIGRSEFVDLHGVVDDQFGGLQRIDQPGIAAEPLHGIAHGGQIDHRRNAGEILQQDTAGREGDFFFPASNSCSRQRGARISSFVTLRPSSVRSRFSSRMRKENGRCLVERPCLSSASSR
jgi:hypothetical protein